MRTALRIGGAALALVAAVVLALAAVDVGRVQRVVRADDSQFDVRSARADWKIHGILPGSLVTSALGLADDLRYRQTLRRVILLRQRQSAAAGSELSVLVADAETSLLEDAAHDPSAVHRSRSLTLLGALTINDPTASRGFDVPSLVAGADRFKEAVALDPANERARENLEIVLRLLRQQGASDKPKADANEPGASTGAGAGDTGDGY